MTPWRIRELHEDDLDVAIRLWDEPAAGSTTPVFGVSDLITAVRAHAPAVVAVVGDELVGAVVANVNGARAMVMRISLAAGWRRKGIGSAMLTELERQLVAAGAHRISCLLADQNEAGALALENCGYTVHPGMRLYEKLEPVGPEDVGILRQLGGHMMRTGAWTQLSGMTREKELIERRNHPAAWEFSRRGKARAGPAAGCHLVRAAWHRQDHLREGVASPARLAVRGAVPVPAGW